VGAASMVGRCAGSSNRDQSSVRVPAPVVVARRGENTVVLTGGLPITTVVAGQRQRDAGG